MTADSNPTNRLRILFFMFVFYSISLMLAATTYPVQGVDFKDRETEFSADDLSFKP
jgi:hypothetical protein